jgi:tRNA(Ile)-lysidine synthase
LIKQFIEKYKLSGTFIVAFSGGYDSMCLLDMLYKSGYDVIAVHLNHNWRGEESLKEEKVCEEFAKSRNIKFYAETLSDDIAHTETCAREARYEFFKRCAKKFNSNVVFTAHNYDDNAETVLYRIIKGTGIAGLCGIAEHRDIFYRPLLKTSRKDIEKYCKNNNLTPNNDSSNENTKYKRNLIRKKILPLMREINPKVIEALNSLSEISKENNSQKQDVRELLIKHNIDYDRKKIEEIYKFINENKNSKSGKTISLTKDLWLFVNDKTLEVITKQKKSTENVKIDKCGEFDFGDFVFSIKPFTEKIKNFPKDSDFCAYINTDKIDFSLRYRKDGDIIQPLGTNGSQKLKKYLNEKKIPKHKKDNIILLCDKNEVLWVSGFGISEKIKVKENPTHIIELRGKL